MLVFWTSHVTFTLLVWPNDNMTILTFFSRYIIFLYIYRYIVCISKYSMIKAITGP
jgi:hypothetical protein